MKNLGSHNGCFVRLKKSLAARKRRGPRVGIRAGKGKSYTALQRLMARVPSDSPCWIIAGQSSHRNQYLILSRDDGSRTQAHRLAYEMFVGPIPDGLVVCHRCDQGRCVNPSHLFLGTQKDNVHDAILKGRFRAKPETRRALEKRYA